MRTRHSLVGATALVAVGLALAAGAGPQTQAPPARPAPTRAAIPAATAAANPELTALHEAFVKAYNTPNPEALAALFTDDAAVVDSAGGATRGRKEIAAMYAASFKEAPGLKLESTPESVTFLTPDVARIEGQTKLTTGGAGDLLQLSRYSSLVVRKDGAWKLAEIRDYPSPAAQATPYDHLAELEWMVGDWVDESANAKVKASVRWADHNSFLVRTYNVEIQGEAPRSGTMFIGWDPQTGQIKSWLFDSDGGHGEGLWTRAADDQWVVKAHGVLLDGRPTSATQVHVILNKDSVKTSSVDRIVGGEIAPDMPEVVMVRKPPPPAGADTAAPPAASTGGAKPAAPGAGK